MRSPSLRARVVVASVLVLVLGVAAIGTTINVLLTRSLSADADAVLRARAEAQLATIRRVRGRVVVRESAQDEVLDRGAWVFAGGRAIARPSLRGDIERAAFALAGARATATRNVGDVRLRAEPALAAERQGSRQIATVVVALSLRPYEDSERIARIGTLALGAFVVLAGGLLAWRAVGAGLRPVAAMAEQAVSYSVRDLSRRFALGPPRDELTALAATLDGLLDRLEASLRHEQRLTAEIAHELRTPLSGMRAEAELALRAERSARERAESLRTIVAEADRLSAAIDALLREAAGRGADGATCELRDAVETALRAGAGAARREAVAVAVVEPFAACRVGAEPAFVAALLGPLLDNAVRHASSSVRISARTRGHAVELTVADDGPGIADEHAEDVFQPGWRTAEGSGAGLGLALARRLARSLGGDVRVGAGAGAGAAVAVELPLVTATG